MQRPIEIQAGQGVILGHGDQGASAGDSGQIKVFRRENIQISALRSQRAGENIEGGPRLIGTDAARLRQDLVGAAIGCIDQCHRRRGVDRQKRMAVSQDADGLARCRQLNRSMRIAADNVGLRTGRSRKARFDFQAQHPAQGVIDALGADHALFDGADDRADQGALIQQVAPGVVVVMFFGQHHQIDAGLEGLNRGFCRIVVALHRAHVHAVGDDHAIETQLAAQQIAEDKWRERGRAFGIKSAEDDMRGHDDFGARLDAGGEGAQVDRVELVTAARHGGQAAVAVKRGIAVAGEVLERRHGAVLLQGARGCGGHLSDLFGLFAKRAHADDRIVGVGIAVGGGPQDDIQADGAGLARDDAVHVVSALRIGGRAQRHIAWSHSAFSGHHRPGPFLIAAEQQGDAEARVGGEGLQPVAKRDGGPGIWHVVVADVGAADQVLFHQDAGFVHLVRGEREHEHLADFFFGAHGANRRFDVHGASLSHEVDKVHLIIIPRKSQLGSHLTMNSITFESCRGDPWVARLRARNVGATFLVARIGK